MSQVDQTPAVILADTVPRKPKIQNLRVVRCDVHRFSLSLSGGVARLSFTVRIQGPRRVQRETRLVSLVYLVYLVCLVERD